MNMLIAMTPTILLVAYSQLITKWRVEALMADMATNTDRFSRILIYLKDPFILSAYLASLFSSFAWMYVAEKNDISIAFPVYIGLTVLLVSLGGVAFFKDEFTASRIVAITLILAGVAIGSRV